MPLAVALVLIPFHSGGRGGRRGKGVGTCCLDCLCMGSNPACGTNENGRWVDPPYKVAQ